MRIEGSKTEGSQLISKNRSSIYTYLLQAENLLLITINIAITTIYKSSSISPNTTSKSTSSSPFPQTHTLLYLTSSSQVASQNEVLSHHPHYSPSSQHHRNTPSSLRLSKLNLNPSRIFPSLRRHPSPLRSRRSRSASRDPRIDPQAMQESMRQGRRRCRSVL